MTDYYGTSGNDTGTFTAAQEPFTWYAQGGKDKLVFSAAGSALSIQAYVFANNGDGSYNYYIYDSATGQYNYAYNVEQVNLTGSSANDTLSGIAGPDTLDGGAGTDLLYALDRSASTAANTYDATAAATSAGTTLTDGTVIKSMELLGTLSTGSGNDKFIESVAQIGATWNAGAGNDTFTFDDSSSSGPMQSYMLSSSGGSVD